MATSKITSTPKKAVKKSTAIKRPRNLLIELGTEELPPKALKKLGQSFAKSIYDHLVEVGVVNTKGNSKDNYQYYASPRRLAVWIKQVAPRQQDRVEERKGPSLKAAYDDNGEPTRAALGFAGSCGVDIKQLETIDTDKGAWLIYQQKVPGEKIQTLVDAALDKAIRALPIPKRMRWGDKNQEFVRPVHWLLAMYGSDLLPVTVLGFKAEAYTWGHRFHAPQKLRVLSADRYLKTLKSDGFVIADFEERKLLIEKQVKRLALRKKTIPVIDPDLLDEVTGLVEWPQAIHGEFEEKYLAVPPEVLVSYMSDHQKYFHLVSEKGKLLPGFITVSNIKSGAPKRVKVGNERVLNARLADAEFFWQSDQKTALIERKDALKKVLFHKKLGSVNDKVERIRNLAETIGKQLEVDNQLLNRAIDLCKTDLVTDMVGEFPELQGTIGRYYAQGQSEHKQVSNAIEQHYLPRFAGDQLPSDNLAATIALADRIDSITGIFACGEIPTGDKDRYGLRRAALGVLRIMIESKLDLDLKELIEQAIEPFGELTAKSNTTTQQVFDYIIERIRAYYQPQGIEASAITSVMAVATPRPVDFAERLHAVQKLFNEQADTAASLAAANKRIANILAKQDTVNAKLNPKLLSEKAEQQLAEKLEKVEEKARKYFANGKYSKGLKQMASLKAPIDKFFDDVMVMDDNKEIRNNRLALLSRIRSLFLEVADISHMRIE